MVLANCLTAMHVMITGVTAQNPALLTRGTTQSGTIARVLSVLRRSTNFQEGYYENTVEGIQCMSLLEGLEENLQGGERVLLIA